MTLVETKVDGKPFSFFMDNMIYRELTTNVKKKVLKRDMDYLLTIDGDEGSGKSVFAFQVAKVLDPDFNINQIVFTPEGFVNTIAKSPKYRCIVFDEAFTGLSSRAALSEVNKLLITTMMEMRQRNLFIIIVMPSVFMLERYVALHRARCLFHVYINKHGKRGNWSFYNRDKLKYLYIIGKKYMEHKVQKPMAWGQFYNRYTVNEELYRKKKSDTLKQKETFDKKEIGHKFKTQADILMYYIHKKEKIGPTEMERQLEPYDLDLKAKQIGRRIKNHQELIKMRNIFDENP